MKRMLNGLLRGTLLGMEFSKPAHNAKSFVVAGMAGEAGKRKILDSPAESNCRFLMMKDNWRGYVMEGSEALIEALKASHYYWKFYLNAQRAFITRDNIAALLERSGFDKDLGLLSIDIDGMDYWIAQELTHWKPRILIMEYNAVFGATRAITVPYAADFNRTAAHPSNLYYGASLKALCKLTAA